MSTPLIVTQLPLKRAEIEAQIESLEDRLGQARADPLHVAATVRLFDTTAVGGPATAYRGATRAIRRRDLFALCRAALGALPEPLCTRQFARHVITAEGWGMDDARLKLAIAHKVGATVKRMSLRGAVQKMGDRQKASVWRLIRTVALCRIGSHDLGNLFYQRDPLLKGSITIPFPRSRTPSMPSMYILI